MGRCINRYKNETKKTHTLSRTDSTCRQDLSTASTGTNISAPITFYFIWRSQSFFCKL